MRKILVAVGVFVLFVTLFLLRIPLKEAAENLFQPDLPEPQKAVDFLPLKSARQPKAPAPNSPGAVRQSAVAPPGNLPFAPLGSASSAPQSPAEPPKTAEPEYLESINLRVPFGSQAPFGNWDMPYQEACEEAAVIMVYRYFKDLPLSAEIMDEEILKLVAWQEKTFGYYKDTTAEEIARMLREYFKFQNVEVRYGITLEDVKAEVRAGRPVILPAAGRLLPNPYFRQPGPLYHALVVKGFAPDGKIITNDPGTRRGEDFLYDPEALMDAVHDWDSTDILRGVKAMVVVRE